MFAGLAAWLGGSALMTSPIGAFLRFIGGSIASFFKALDVQGWIGLIVAGFLAFHWLNASGDARHWHKQSARYEALYNREHMAFGQTVLNYRAAAVKAAADDAANKSRVEAEQAKINQERDRSYEARIADARAAAQRLRDQLAAANSGSAAKPPVPGLPAPSGGVDGPSSQDGLSIDDRLTATEQSIQLDEIIKWVRQQHEINPNGGGK